MTYRNGIWNWYKHFAEIKQNWSIQDYFSPGHIYKSERADSTGKYYISSVLHIFWEILQEEKMGRSNLT